MAELIAKVEERLRDHPEDGQGWDAIGPVYLVQQRYAEAADAFKKAIALLGETPKRLQGYAQAAISAANGIVKDDAKRALETLLARDADNLEARFWLAVAKEQDGKLLAASEALKSMLMTRAVAPPAPATKQLWRDRRRERLEDLMAGAPLGAVWPKAWPAPVRARPMCCRRPGAVARGTRSHDRGHGRRAVRSGSRQKAATWRAGSRLVNAYVVLDRKSEARAALAEARRNFAGDKHALGELERWSAA